MGITAAKTLVLSRDEAPKESTSSATTKAENFDEMSARLRSRPQKKVEVWVDPVKIWRAEKPGKKSSFLQDMLAHNE